jgi:hypothetical protein
MINSSRGNIHMKPFGLATGALALTCGSSVFGGAHIDLRPAEEGPYAPNQVVNVEVFVVDTDNLPRVLFLRTIQLDFSDTVGTLDVQVNAPFFEWELPNYDGEGYEYFSYPITGWMAPPFPPPPHDGEVFLGRTLVNVGAEGGVLDLMTPTNQTPTSALLSRSRSAQRRRIR